MKRNGVLSMSTIACLSKLKIKQDMEKSVLDDCLQMLHNSKYTQFPVLLHFCFRCIKNNNYNDGQKLDICNQIRQTIRLHNLIQRNKNNSGSGMLLFGRRGSRSPRRNKNKNKNKNKNNKNGECDLAMIGPKTVFTTFEKAFTQQNLLCQMFFKSLEKGLMTENRYNGGNNNNGNNNNNNYNFSGDSENGTRITDFDIWLLLLIQGTCDGQLGKKVENFLFKKIETQSISIKNIENVVKQFDFGLTRLSFNVSF